MSALMTQPGASTAPLGDQAREELGAVMRDYLAATTRLAQTHEALQQEVTRLRNELEDKNRELERRRRLATLGEMAAGVAHEVRNPLGAIQLYNGLLRTACAGAPPALELIGKIDGGIRAIESVVQDTLALTPRGGPLEMQPIEPIARQARETCAHLLAGRNVTCQVDVDENAPSAELDARAMQRVLINLISNAAEASGAGQTVRVRIEKAGDNQVRISVRDHGTGIDAGLLEKIFDPFFTTRARGTGLGLAIAHRVVEAHGGRLTARNAAEGGAEFTIELPITSRTRPPAAARQKNSADCMDAAEHDSVM